MPFYPSLLRVAVECVGIPPGKFGRRGCWHASAGLRILGLFTGFSARTTRRKVVFFLINIPLEWLSFVLCTASFHSHCFLGDVILHSMPSEPTLLGIPVVWF